MQKAEFEELNSLQILLLALVNLGLASPYDLLSKAGLGVGLTSPALKRLANAGLLDSTPGPRKRLRYTVTPEGKDQLRQSLAAGPGFFWRHGQTDIFESLPRGIILAWLHSELGAARYGVERARRDLLKLAVKREREAKELRDSVQGQADGPEPKTAGSAALMAGTAYRWVKAESEAILYRLQAQATEEIEQLLETLPPPPHPAGDKDQT